MLLLHVAFTNPAFYFDDRARPTTYAQTLQKATNIFGYQGQNAENLKNERGDHQYHIRDGHGDEHTNTV